MPRRSPHATRYTPPTITATPLPLLLGVLQQLTLLLQETTLSTIHSQCAPTPTVKLGPRIRIGDPSLFAASRKSSANPRPYRCSLAAPCWHDQKYPDTRIVHLQQFPAVVEQPINVPVVHLQQLPPSPSIAIQPLLVTDSTPPALPVSPAIMPSSAPPSSIESVSQDSKGPTTAVSAVSVSGVVELKTPPPSTRTLSPISTTVLTTPPDLAIFSTPVRAAHIPWDIRSIVTPDRPRPCLVVPYAPIKAVADIDRMDFLSRIAAFVRDPDRFDFPAPAVVSRHLFAEFVDNLCDALKDPNSALLLDEEDLQMSCELIASQFGNEHQRKFASLIIKVETTPPLDYELDTQLWPIEWA